MRAASILTSLLFVAAGAACDRASSGGDRGAGTRADAVVTTASTADAPRVDASAPRRPSCPGPRATNEVTFPASDGFTVHATVVLPCAGKIPIVVLAHQMCKDRAEWKKTPHDWVDAFAERGIGTLAIDLRGHGESKAWPGGATHDLCAEVQDKAALPLYAGMVLDVEAALAYAEKSLDAKSVAVVGASIGANAALVAFAADPRAAIVVALSPGLEYRGIKTDAAVHAAASRAMILEAAQDDERSASSVLALKKANPSIDTVVWPAGGHANAMIDAHPSELTRLVGLVAAKL